jgi:hypothetical protein
LLPSGELTPNCVVGSEASDSWRIVAHSEVTFGPDSSG